MNSWNADLNQTPAARSVEIDLDTAGQRIDNFLTRVLKGVPRSHLYRILRRGEVRVNRGRIGADYRLQAGDLVRLPPVKINTASSSSYIAPKRLNPIILFEDERILIVDKPAGLAVHGGSGLQYGLIETLRVLRPGRPLELVHRIDRETSGCLIVSKRRSALRELHELIRAGNWEKRYLAVLIGNLNKNPIDVQVPLKKSVLRGGERIVQVDLHSGRPAHTRFQCLKSLCCGTQQLTLVEATPLTGRTHQIRVHAAHLGLPIAGDPKYGDEIANRILRNCGLQRLFLHAQSIKFQLGYQPQPIYIEAPLAPELASFLANLATKKFI